MEKSHGHILGLRYLCQQFGQGGFHLGAMDTAVIEDERDLLKAELDITQDNQGQHGNGVFGFGLGLKIDGGLAAAQLHGQEAVHFLPAALIAGQGGRRVLFRPGVMGVGGGFQGEFIEGNEGCSGAGLCGFFSSSLTNSLRCPGLAGP